MRFAIPFPDISPVLVEIPLGFATVPIRWYALAYIAGVIAGYYIFRALRERAHLWAGETPPLTRPQMEDFLTWIVLGIILGGRMGYVLFYGEGQFLEDPMAILRVWEGGMSFHGGFLGVVIAGLIFSWKNGIDILKFGDGLAVAVPPGLFFGRIANFINAELWGRPTDVPWGVIFPGNAAQTCPGIEGLCARHPSQLYEAGLEGILLGGLLLWLSFRGGWLKRPGALIGVFLAGYGVSRFLVEFVRQADPQFMSPDNPLGYAVQLGSWGLTQGQRLSLPMILVGLALLVLAWRRARQRA
jgi:phosphatidylglycerol---prolipoprotein diacylglyceryl transferase